MRDGVIQFEPVHTDADVACALTLNAAEARALIGWRNAMRELGFIGQDPLRYDNVGFGNVSVRVPPFRGPRGQDSAFLITGSQTGHKPTLAMDDLCLVQRFDLARNRAHSLGRVLPSSESLTHGAVYDVVPHARAVIHVHAPLLFRAADRLGLPTTRAEVGYGTVAMAREVARLWRSDRLSDVRVFSMAGHEDGIVALGETLDEAGARLMAVLARALAPS